MNQSAKDFIASLPKQIGETVVFNGTRPHWFEKFIKDANANLKVGQFYTIKDILPASSHTVIVLEEFPDLKFNYHWFS